MRKTNKLLFLIVIFYATSALSMINNSIKPSQFFTGRSEYLNLMDNIIVKNKVVYINGLGGVGKTQLVRKYVESKNNYNIIWWFDCDYAFKEQVINFAEKINTASERNKELLTITDNLTLEEVVKFLDQTNKKWLFVFENIDDLNTKNELIKLEKVKHGHLIFSSRQELSQTANIELSNFQRYESIEFIKKILDEYTQIKLNELAEILQDYPLALEQAASFLIANPILTLKEYRELLQKEKGRVFTTVKTKSTGSEYKTSLTATIKLTFNKIRSNSPESYRLLIYCKYLDNQNISNELLKKTYKELKENFSLLNYMQTLNPLIQYSLLSLSKEVDENDNKKNFQMHKLVQLALQEENIQLVDDKKHVTRLVKIVDSIIPEPGEISKLMQYCKENPNIIRNAEKILEQSKSLAINNNHQFALGVKLLRIYMFNLQYSKAEKLGKYLEQGIFNKKYKITSDISKVYLATYYMLNAVLRHFAYSDYQLAISNLEKANDLLKGIIQGVPIKYVTLCQLAQTFLYAGDIEKASKYIPEIEELLMHNSIDANTGLFYFIKAKTELEQGKFLDALETAKKGKEFTAKEFPGDKFIIIPDIVLYSDILLNLERVKEAFAEIKGVYDESFNYIDSDHELQSRILVTLANIENKLDKQDLARAHILRAITIKKNIYRDNDKNFLEQDDDLAAAYIVYGDILANEDDIPRAQKYYLEAIKIYHNRFGDKIQWNSLGEAYKKALYSSLKLGDRFTAIQFFNKHKNNFGLDHFRSKEMYLKMKEYNIEI